MIKCNNKEIIGEYFKNNEIRIRNLDYVNDSLFELKYESSDDLISLMFLKKAYDDKKLTSYLYIKYMPYSRMDREFTNDLFLLKYIASFINELNFKKVFILEPHSKVTEELINNIVVISPMNELLDLVKKDINFSEYDHIVYPDLGSFKRYYNKDIKNFIKFNKKRDENTTLIKKLYVESGKVNKKSKCIIIDDLIATGNTANNVAKILKERGASKVYVLTVHTENQIINNHIIDDLYIDKIYTTDSILTINHFKIELLLYNHIINY